MRQLALLNLKPGDKVVDLGVCEIWSFVETPLEITIVNLPGVDLKPVGASIHAFRLVTSDATDLKDYSDNHFDLVFSNSVIQHVGGEEQELAFAREARRLALLCADAVGLVPAGTAHRHSALVALPELVRKRMIDRWRRKLPAWTEMIEVTTVISRKKLKSYFPDGTLITERVADIPKSYAMYRAAARD
jgi:hypothetical protein